MEKGAAVLDLKSQLDLFAVPDREKMFDLSIEPISSTVERPLSL